MTQKIEFLRFFYRVMLICGFVGLPVCFLFGGLSGGGSYGLGFFSIALIIGLWHLTLHYTLKPRKTHWIWESLLIFVRYALLGVLFYAMISLFVVSWLWYIAGTIIILPALLISTLLYDRETTTLE